MHIFGVTKLELNPPIRVGDPWIRGIIKGLEKIIGPSKGLEEVYSAEWVENDDGSYSKLFKIILSDKSTHMLKSSHSIPGTEYFKQKLAGQL